MDSKSPKIPEHDRRAIDEIVKGDKKDNLPFEVVKVTDDTIIIKMVDDSISPRDLFIDGSIDRRDNGGLGHHKIVIGYGGARVLLTVPFKSGIAVYVHVRRKNSKLGGRTRVFAGSYGAGH